MTYTPQQLLNLNTLPQVPKHPQWNMPWHLCVGPIHPHLQLTVLLPHVWHTCQWYWHWHWNPWQNTKESAEDGDCDSNAIDHAPYQYVYGAIGGTGIIGADGLLSLSLVLGWGLHLWSGRGKEREQERERTRMRVLWQIQLHLWTAPVQSSLHSNSHLYSHSCL